MFTSAAKSLSPEAATPPTAAPDSVKFEARKRFFETLLEREFPPPRKTEIYLMPEEGVVTSANEIKRAIRRAGRQGIVDFSVGIYEAGLLDAPIEMICHDGGTAVLRGESRVASSTVLIRGFLLEATDSGVALKVLSGTAMLEDCEIQGRIEVAAGAGLYIKNCGIESNGDAITISPGGTTELIASRIVTAGSAVRAGAGSGLSLYACRFQPRDTIPGTAVVSEGGTVYAEGCEFFENGVGVDLVACPEASFASCAFENNSEPALRWHAASPDASLQVVGSIFSTSSFAPPITLHGGSMVLSRTKISSLAECIHAVDARIKAVDVEWSTSVEQPVGLEGSASIDGSQISTGDNTRVIPPARPDTPASTLDRALSQIDKIIGQEDAKLELRKIVQQAWAAGQRGERIGRQSIATVFFGPARHGQAAAAVQLAAALTEIGVLNSTSINHLGIKSLSDHSWGESPCGLYLLDSSQYSSGLINSFIPRLIDLLRNQPDRTTFVISGEAERLKTLLRRHSELNRLIPHEVGFSELEPRDLAAYFKMYCEEERIPVGTEAARKLLIVIHALHDGFGRQFSDTEGLQELFLEVRRNYLARCAVIGRLDAELEPSDITIPIHRRALALWTRSAEFLALCPKCGAETPWLPSLAPRLLCIHCGAPVHSEWGILRGSSFFRKIQTRSEPVRSGAVAFRRASSRKV
ncbi:MAG: hypothetical protein Fur0032_12560 [Terrimicrobiaceae bacterium]